MRNQFEEQLALLHTELLEMGALIERAIQKATQALVNQDTDAAGEAIAADAEVDHKEKDVESLCLKLLLRQQPVAGDLRLISAALKMITDMERIGDQAADIAGIATYLAGEPYIKELEHLPRMAEEAIQMVTGSLDAFVKRDVALARRVMDMDDVIDGLFDVIKAELIGLIRKDAANGSQAIDLLMIAKYFERIGDHAQNVAEWVEYAITGRHKGAYL
ncbi:MAG: phosphate signaling complex protein PhoU [Clostridiales bacterium]|nr:phosphate signaling complex protein PhoU [Clostridiales bacterium]MDO4351139.1 phosphate signaling complex protein PhoU [Eubacteriales bacterium]MDY4007752.1 phosphate signaling complex protein PhoU [Candidatus Limiplasma sp.]